MSTYFEVDTDQIYVASQAKPIRIHVTLTKVTEMREFVDGKVTTTITREVAKSWNLNPDEDDE